MIKLLAAGAAFLAIGLTACSQPAQPGAAVQEEASAVAKPAKADAPAPAPAPEAQVKAAVLTLDGLGELAIGKPVAAASGFAERGAQTPGGGCKTLTASAYPGVYALVEGGVLRRITLREGSSVKLVEGIGAGSSEAAVMAAFPGFRAEPHKYVEAPAKDLFQPGAAPRLRFEVDAARKVSAVHVGLEPQLGYVEGCA